MRTLLAVAVAAGIVYASLRFLSKMYAEIEFEFPEDWSGWSESEWGEWYGDD